MPNWVVIELIIYTFLALPWIFAHVGVYISDIPLLNLFFVAKEPNPCSYGVTVHLGNHHGLSGYLMLITSRIMLNMWLITKSENIWRKLTLFLISLVQAFGLYLFIEDFINEQFYRFFGKEVLPGYEFLGLNYLTGIIVLIGIGLFVINWLIISRYSNAVSLNAPELKIN